MVPSLDIFDGDLTFKLVSFFANGVIIVHSLKTRVIMKLIEKHGHVNTFKRTIGDKN
jgi:hypothetical protein